MIAQELKHGDTFRFINGSEYTKDRIYQVIRQEGYTVKYCEPPATHWLSSCGRNCEVELVINP